MASSDFSDRYVRHLALPEVGEQGQEKLSKSRVAIVGLGGLGSPAAMYLAAAGVGQLALIDADTVSVSNLHRQLIHDEHSLGELKVVSAANRLKALNTFCATISYGVKLTDDNADELISDCDAIVDASDNYAARFTISRVAARKKIPHIYGAIRRFEGQACVFDPGRGTACYQCLHHPGAKEQNNDEASAEGLLGPLPGMIGAIQAMETLKYLLGVPSPLVGKLLTVDTMSMQFRQIQLKADPNCDCSH